METCMLEVYADGTKGDPEHFVAINSDGDFILGCNKFFVAGWNEWEVVEAGAGAPVLYGASLPAGYTGPQLLRELLDGAVVAGLNVMRMFAVGSSEQYALQTSPGIFSGAMFGGLDYALDQARQRGIKLIMVLLNNWNDYGSVMQLVRWSGSATAHEQFFSDPNCQQLYKASVAAVIGRVNSINGRRYSEDPTIFAWNLINEPRCYNCPDALQAWIQMMAPYVKSLDSNHLLTIGAEGFYAAGDPRTVANPGGTNSWANTEGQDFVNNYGVSGIDFAAMHLWADNWLDTDPTFPQTWIAQHIADAQSLGKPLLLEEFGKYVSGRDAFYTAIYSEIESAAQSGAPLKGSAFWQWVDNKSLGAGDGGYGVDSADSTFQIIQRNAAAMRQLETPAGVCTAAVTSTVNNCSSTWVNGLPGTGYEGPSCRTDINECVRATHNCAANAGCINTAGSFRCICYYGYHGDGVSGCSLIDGSAPTSSLFSGSDMGRLACREGWDITYPPGAPGFQYDPTGGFAYTNGYGNLAPVNLDGCMRACLAASACTSVSYSDSQQKCYLKRNASSSNCLDASGHDWQTYRRTSGPTPAVASSQTSTSDSSYDQAPSSYGLSSFVGLFKEGLLPGQDRGR